MARPELEQLRQRVTVGYHLKPLEADETAAYVNHRLQCAAAGTPLVFPREVTDLIHYHSGGVPRKINIIADAILLFGYGEEQQVIDATLTQVVIEELEATGVIVDPHAARTVTPSAAPLQIERPAPAQDNGLAAREAQLADRERLIAEQQRLLFEGYRLLRAQHDPSPAPVAPTQLAAPTQTGTPIQAPAPPPAEAPALSVSQPPTPVNAAGTQSFTPRPRPASAPYERPAPVPAARPAAAAPMRANAYASYGPTPSRGRRDHNGEPKPSGCAWAAPCSASNPFSRNRRVGFDVTHQRHLARSHSFAPRVGRRRRSRGASVCRSPSSSHGPGSPPSASISASERSPRSTRARRISLTCDGELPRLSPPAGCARRPTFRLRRRSTPSTSASRHRFGRRRTRTCRHRVRYRGDRRAPASRHAGDSRIDDVSRTTRGAREADARSARADGGSRLLPRVLARTRRPGTRRSTRTTCRKSSVVSARVDGSGLRAVCDRDRTRGSGRIPGSSGDGEAAPKTRSAPSTSASSARLR